MLERKRARESHDAGRRLLQPPVALRIAKSENLREPLSSSQYLASALGDSNDILSSISSDAGNGEHGVTDAHSHISLEDDLTVLRIVARVGVLLGLEADAVDVAWDDVLAELGLVNGLRHELGDLLDFPARLYRVNDPLLRLIVGCRKLDELGADCLCCYATS